jgi:hypothetical protein
MLQKAQQIVFSPDFLSELGRLLLSGRRDNDQRFRTKYEIGKLLIREYQLVQYKRQLEWLDALAEQTMFSRSELYRCFKLAEKFKTFDDFIAALDEAVEKATKKRVLSVWEKSETEEEIRTWRWVANHMLYRHAAMSPDREENSGKVLHQCYLGEIRGECDGEVETVRICSKHKSRLDRIVAGKD